MRNALLHLSRKQKSLLLFAVDSLFVELCIIVAMLLRYGHFNWLSFDNGLVFLLLAPLATWPFSYRLGLYKTVLRFTNRDAINNILKANALSAISLLALDALLAAEVFALPDFVLPRSVPFIYFLLLSVSMISSRLVLQSWLSGNDLLQAIQQVFMLQEGVQLQLGKPVVIIGTGKALSDIVNVLDTARDYRPVALIDYDGEMIGRQINGKDIFSYSDICSLKEQFSIEEILLALPELKRKDKQKLIGELEALALPIRTMASLDDLSAGRVSLADVQDIDIADVLGREEVHGDAELMSKTVTGKSILVTGAGGSIGSELLRQLLKLEPTRLVLVDHAEFNLYSIEREIRSSIDNLGLAIELIPILANVLDLTLMTSVMTDYKVNTVYHGAAYKHVPLVESNIAQSLENNVLGTVHCAYAAILAKVDSFVLISTDKAVRPTNIMGASKRLAELALQAFTQESQLNITVAGKAINATNNTCFSMVRFGNVLGSSGSVIPIFKEQIRTGGPITVTHPDIIRYFMSIPEAASLVIQAAAMAKGGDVFVLDMGEPVKIVDLAKRMLSLSGLSLQDESQPQGDIEITFTGLRPGEKLYEELLIGNNPQATEHERIFKAEEEYFALPEYFEMIADIQGMLEESDIEQLQKLLQNTKIGYQPVTS